jgi:N-alpha-acetyltransferase 15/16, NatA auxiliary subunit
LPECPTTVLWVYYYLSQHYDRLRIYQKALKFIEEAIKHTPTLIELYMVKAKIYKVNNNMKKFKFVENPQIL